MSPGGVLRLHDEHSELLNPHLPCPHQGSGGQREGTDTQVNREIVGEPLMGSDRVQGS